MNVSWCTTKKKPNTGGPSPFPYLKTKTFPVSEMLCILSPGKKRNIPKNLDGLQNLTRSSAATYFCLLSDLPVHSTKLG